MNSQHEYNQKGAVSVEAIPPYQLQVAMRDGRNVRLDLQELIESREVYWRLRQVRYFCMVRVDQLGGIYWPEGEDLAPDGLDRYLY